MTSCSSTLAAQNGLLKFSAPSPTEVCALCQSTKVSRLSRARLASRGSGGGTRASTTFQGRGAADLKRKGRWREGRRELRNPSGTAANLAKANGARFAEPNPKSSYRGWDWRSPCTSTGDSLFNPINQSDSTGTADFQTNLHIEQPHGKENLNLIDPAVPYFGSPSNETVAHRAAPSHPFRG
eukprot:scaffold2663_cov256-Pinguiococcus_pyrenoidosus.AAC.13